MKVLFFISLAFIMSCSPSSKRKDAVNGSRKNRVGLTSDQQASFDAFNTLQINTDEKNRIYSTFPNLEQRFYPPDSSFMISQGELHTALMDFVKMNCSNLNSEVSSELVSLAVLAQENYQVLHCKEENLTIMYNEGLPQKGIWVMPNVLDRRDILIFW